MNIALISPSVRPTDSNPNTRATITRLGRGPWGSAGWGTPGDPRNSQGASPDQLTAGESEIANLNRYKVAGPTLNHHSCSLFLRGESPTTQLNKLNLQRHLKSEGEKIVTFIWRDIHSNSQGTQSLWSLPPLPPPFVQALFQVPPPTSRTKLKGPTAERNKSCVHCPHCPPTVIV